MIKAVGKVKEYTDTYHNIPYKTCHDDGKRRPWVKCPDLALLAHVPGAGIVPDMDLRSSDLEPSFSHCSLPVLYCTNSWVVLH